MYEFVSWIEKEHKVYFLTTKLIDSEKGRTLLKDSKEDITRHGAIRLFFGLEQDEGMNRECTDFSNPDGFPTEIVEALKAGELRGTFLPKGLLKKSLYDKYWADFESLVDKYWADFESLDDKYWGLCADTKNRAKAWK